MSTDGFIAAARGDVKPQRVFFAVVAMTASGVVAFAGSIMFLMKLGLKYHGNYEYYRPFVGLAYVVGIAAFVLPGVLIWRQEASDRPWQFSLRGALMATTLFAVILALFAMVQ
jgi:hypothetical protein